MSDSKIRRLISKRLFFEMFCNAIEWQDSLIDAHTLMPWHQTKRMTKQANRFKKRRLAYIKLYQEMRDAVKKGKQ